MSPHPPAAPNPALWRLVETWQRACADFLVLVRSLDEAQGSLPTDLPGWDVHANVAHTTHLEAVLAGAPEDTVEVPDAAHLTSPTSRYTEQGVLARRGRTLAELADELEQAVATRLAALRADPPTDASAPAPRTPADQGWPTGLLLRNRPFDVWLHDQDVRRAVGRPGGYDSPAAAHTLDVLGSGLPMVVGKRVAPSPGSTVRVVVPDAGRRWTLVVGQDGRAVPGTDADPATTTVTLSAEDLVVLGAGRRGPDQVQARVEGDVATGERLLASLAVTP
ncbi:maleylpyruvate isomerase family mycothiol-dependent enzyme [Marmoricola sp. Leaf446]|uniref:maleylpyruvate isomerase family mycothiol-dependent enzyme n=1 Tax=Marmoricola sp. Leaf446 TaxID=1736379 RepID=UPI0009EA9086|nr:maleylpyruvate isomerase family mycothiol-dependent enzyme [Marmoricola sp. Leaf446]